MVSIGARDSAQGHTKEAHNSFGGLKKCNGVDARIGNGNICERLNTLSQRPGGY
jgi:hypothetical protein